MSVENYTQVVPCDSWNKVHLKGEIRMRKHGEQLEAVLFGKLYGAAFVKANLFLRAFINIKRVYVNSIQVVPFVFAAKSALEMERLGDQSVQTRASRVLFGLGGLICKGQPTLEIFEGLQEHNESVDKL